MPDPTGQVLIPHLAAGAYSVVIAARNFLTNRLKVKVAAGQAQKLTTKMEVNEIPTLGVVVVSGSTVEAEPVRLPPVSLPR